ncbi:MAG: hypothetical protein JWQ35_2402 [Bacteriovoracaceae bacterium]|nr:hypothetical protein [Bacteriovoracaceae bacterium]
MITNSLKILFSISICVQVTSLFANAANPEKIIYCKEPEVVGLYEQCQEVLIQSDLGDRVRAYSTASREVLMVPKKNLFYTDSFKEFEKVKSNQLIGIASIDLWNSSSAGFQSLCRTSNESKTNMLTISCGRFRKETILKLRAFRLTPYSQMDARRS